MVLLAVLVDDATPTIATAAAAEAQAAAEARTVASTEDGRGAAMLDPYDPEAAAYAQDAECRDCEARRMGHGGVGGAESMGSGGSRPGASWHEFTNRPLLSAVAGSPSSTLCEDLGAVTRGRMTAALGAVGVEEGHATASEDPCRDKRVVKELLASWTASTGSALEDAPCVTQNSRRLRQREASSHSADGEGHRHARSLPPEEAVVELGGEERVKEEGAALAAAAAAALAASAIGGAAPTTPSEGASLPLPTILKARTMARILRSKSSDKRRSRRATSCGDDSGESRSSSSTSSSNSSSVDPCICDGVFNGATCCSATCGTCGGSGCSSRGDDGEECCTSSIVASGVLCSETGGKAPCVVVEGENDRGTA